nr:PREDICTED: voltage-dependent calcium channel subunit alpha-2/delta-4-like [Paralichthys olivaceus]
MQIAAAAEMNRWGPGRAGNATKSYGSGPRGGRLMMLVWIILFSSLCLMVDGQMKIPPETVQQWAVSFGKEIAAMSARYSGAKLLQKKFKDIEGMVKIEEVDGEELVKKFAEEMEEMLGRKMKSVKRLAEAAEDADLYHEYNETLEFDYYNSMMINTYDEEGNSVPLGGEFPLEENEHFNKLPVNTQLSNIQVPTNVYNRDPDILNGAYMSEALNDVFIDNFQKDPTLTWQYFGSSTGFFRLYPGIKWTPDENGVVTFDSRNRNWHFKLLVEELHVKGEGKVKYAMKESFKILNEAAALGQGSLCNQAIMLITDGAMEDFQDVFKEFNWPERRVRVFTYLIGREMTFAENVKWIACNNKGYYTHVSTLADVQENVMEYLHVLSRPMVINHDHDIIWTEAYMDSVLFNTQAQSLLLMTSVAMPVFSKKQETLSHGILLGVVGTDVALRELMRLAPRYKLGVHGYAYLITNNGYILSHPDLRPLYKEGKKLKPKPNYNSVDLSEVEWEDTEEKLRTAMVKGETGTLSIDVRTSVDKGTRVMFLKNDYFHTVLNETPFSCHYPWRIVISTTAVTVTVGKKTAIAGAIGVQMTLEAFESTFWSITSQPNDTDCSDVEGVCPLRCNSFDIDCYLVDNNGFVLISKQRNDAGRFFGEIDGSVMTTLIRMGMFKRVSLFDYQAMCKMNLHSVSSARPLLSPFYGLASALKWFLSNFLLFLLEFNICGFWHTEHFADAKPSFSVSSAHKKKGDILQPCDTEYPSFVYEPSVKETNSIIKCGRCQKMFVVHQIPDSNLLMLVVQADCDCSRQYSPITMEPKEVKYNASVKCDRMRSQKIRRRPESCHAYHPQENANDCGRASFISLSVSLFFICLSFSAIVS